VFDKEIQKFHILFLSQYFSEFRAPLPVC